MTDAAAPAAVAQLAAASKPDELDWVLFMARLAYQGQRPHLTTTCHAEYVRRSL